ncbi:MAG: DNA-3-methyladenine glycosylase [Patescibacteria group bacterium]|nr:DNA-3-methyladenine glycosylase [Patescibacteria group bacterium]MDD5490273.1 DNA-3-methyladenine glycosylase [Patescibacteria group bacterium]
MKKLPPKFYNQPTLKVAKKLLGKYLVRKIGKKKLVGRIVETEAYVGPEDKASHASRGRTPRTELMFGEAGRAYIYLIYGMYYCFNIVTENRNYPAAVLIRVLEPVAGFKNNNPKLMDGPGKLCREMKIDKKLNGKKLNGDELYITEGEKNNKRQIKSAKRIGIDYAEEWKHKPWRFYLKNSPAISK